MTPMPPDTVLKCESFVEFDEVALRNYRERRELSVDTFSVPTSCQALKKRNYFPVEPKNPTEVDWPLLYVKIVTKNYLFIEKALAMNYSPYNQYCFVLDSKAAPIFKTQMRNLSACLINEDALPLHTNGYIIAVTKKLRGSSHLDVYWAENNREHLYQQGRWSMAELKIFREAYGRSGFHCNTVTLEIVFSAPGVGFPLKCIDRQSRADKMPYMGISRFLIDMKKEANQQACYSNRTDPRGYCILGVEHLQQLSTRRELHALTIDVAFDHGVVSCMHELLFNRTYRYYDEVVIDNGSPNLNQYENLLEVQYSKWLAKADDVVSSHFDLYWECALAARSV
ncbi:hypothetical protein QR680_001583 [Steinernema hermaphroditum]|uniref:Uncharacterized protein n=1 Tax=Steinernema hermaphroditum TaxID=289476 RepID=A0AA39GZS3_9BILA|nr:hypothetical protein QR680_001583 [Steinernema hermaphroditum]